MTGISIFGTMMTLQAHCFKLLRVTSGLPPDLVAFKSRDSQMNIVTPFVFGSEL
jgi:hypothetical protein